MINMMVMVPIVATMPMSSIASMMTRAISIRTPMRYITLIVAIVIIIVARAFIYKLNILIR